MTQSEPYKIIIKNLQSRMRELSLSQIKLAQKANIPHQSVYKLLKGQRSPSIELLEKISLALGCKLYELFEDKSEQKTLHTKENLYNIFCEALEKINSKEYFSDFTEASINELLQTVRRFGGWNFLYTYLCEELEIRLLAEKEYKQIRDSIHDKMTKSQISEAKRKMIITKMIAEKAVKEN